MREDVQEEQLSDEPMPATTAPRTGTVLALLVLAAGVFSYLAGYAVVGALLAAELISPWPPDRDPRPRWVAVTFMVTLLFLSALAFTIRSSSRRQLQRIDEIGSD